MKVRTDNKAVVKKHTGSCLCVPQGRGEGFGVDKRNILQPGEDWKEIFDTLTDMVTVHDNDFNIISANAAAKRILGLPSPYTGNAKCFEYYHGSGYPPEGCPGCDCLGTGKPATFEGYEPHLKRYIEIRAIPRYDNDNRLTGIIHIVRDITSRKRVEEELEIHRNHLKWLVKQRTSEISFANEQLRREIAERERVEAETERLLRELKELLRNSQH